MFLSFCGKSPRNEGAAFVAANATVQGDVILKPGSTVWYGAVLRGDDGTLTLGENSNVQDNAVLHCDPGGQVVLGKNVTVGHSAIVPGNVHGGVAGLYCRLLLQYDGNTDQIRVPVDRLLGFPLHQAVCQVRRNGRVHRIPAESGGPNRDRKGRKQGKRQQQGKKPGR